jgi:phasin family protein
MIIEEPAAIVPEPVAEAAVAVEAVVETNPVAEEPVPAAVVETVSAEPAKTTPKLTPSQGIKTMIKSTEEIVAFNQANVEAFVKSSQIWATGMQELTKQFASTAKTSFEESVASFKALTSVKSVKEAVELQTSFAKTAFEKAVAESNKLTDASIKLTEQTLAPITARVTVAVETFGKAA